MPTIASQLTLRSGLSRILTNAEVDGNFSLIGGELDAILAGTAGHEAGLAKQLSGSPVVPVNGIKFPSAQVASADANTLDDYEEGTWTPFIAGGTTAGVGTYVWQVGRYTKIGNLVSITLYIMITSHTGTGAFLITGLPFTSMNVGGVYHSCTVGQASDLTSPANTIIGAYIPPNNTIISLVITPIGGGVAAQLGLDVSCSIMLVSTYMV